MNAKDVKTAGHRPIDWRGMFFDGSIKVLFLLALVSGGAVWYLKGADAVWDSTVGEFWLLLSFIPKIAVAMCVAALVTALVPRSLIAAWLGDKAGLKGISFATGVGAITPGGPMISFPLVAALSRAGSGRASLIAYLTSWEVLGFQRILIWELQFLGVELLTIRWLASVPLPFIAALLSVYLPKDRPPPEAETGGKA
jgi:uncharacterized membrane protein YraQ (UPF0718 family)